MIKIEQINQEINALPEEAQLLLIDFTQVLKKRYSQTEIEVFYLYFLNLERDFFFFFCCFKV
jgi:hypothetical protein